VNTETREPGDVVNDAGDIRIAGGWRAIGGTIFVTLEQAIRAVPFGWRIEMRNNDEGLVRISRGSTMWITP
jgi:hypothetical protein